MRSGRELIRMRTINAIFSSRSFGGWSYDSAVHRLPFYGVRAVVSECIYAGSTPLYAVCVYVPADGSRTGSGRELHVL